MPYKVMVIDEKVNLPIIVDAMVNSTGMNALLKHLTDLKRRERNAFMHTLIDTGCAEHLGQPDDAKHYSISVVSVDRT